MIKKIITVLLIFFCSISSFAQIYEPVKWSQELKSTGPTTADIIIRAAIDDGWHVYGLNLPKGGPVPTSIVFETIENGRYNH